jgi:prepilin-type N-terminal cleavage/methylation domain-containing protein
LKAVKRANHTTPKTKRAEPLKNDRGVLRKASCGFTLIELLIVISIIGIMLSVSLPISFGMFESYKASLKAQEVMLFISGLRRDSFLYSEGKIVSSKDDALTVDDKEKVFEGVRIRLDSPIVFYRNGTTSGGVIRIHVGGQAYTLSVGAPLGDLLLTRSGMV